MCHLFGAQVLELDPGNAAAAAKEAKLQPVVEERREKMKEEMIGAQLATPKPPPFPRARVRACVCLAHLSSQLTSSGVASC